MPSGVELTDVRPRRRTDQERRISPFWSYWAASATSRVGDGITSVALPLLALTSLDATNFEVGLLTGAGYAATVLVGLPAGVLVRRFALRRVQVTMDGIRALAMLSVPLVAWWGPLTLRQLLVVAFVVGLASNLFDVANSTFLPAVVPKRELTARNGLMSGTVATTSLVGPAVGGLLVQAIGAAYGIVVDAATFVVSAVLLNRIPEADAPPAPVPGAGLFRQVGDGLRYVVAHPVIRPSMLAATAVNFGNGILLAVTPPFLVRTLGLPAGAVGLVIAAESIGSIVAAALVARLVRRLGSAPALLLGSTVGPLLGLAMPLAGTAFAPVIFGFGTVGLAAGVTVLSVVTRTHRQTASPPELLSRVMASVRFVSWGVIPLGAVLGGAVAQLWSPRAGLGFACLAALAAPLALWASRVRTLRELDDIEVPAPGPATPATPGVTGG